VIRRVELRGPGFSATVGRAEGCAVETRVDSLVCSSAFPARSDYELLREELSVVGRDAVFEEVLDLALRLAETDGRAP
jgi:hypothetical protein